eukprot:NODE_20_length_39102_cov_0.325513.p8 type:complete len:385 gc:universal NODE_20_length_39102_cov_0.325513:21946-20792(-)
MDQLSKIPKDTIIYAIQCIVKLAEDVKEVVPEVVDLKNNLDNLAILDANRKDIQFKPLFDFIDQVAVNLETILAKRKEMKELHSSLGYLKWKIFNSGDYRKMVSNNISKLESIKNAVLTTNQLSQLPAVNPEANILDDAFKATHPLAFDFWMNLHTKTANRVAVDWLTLSDAYKLTFEAQLLPIIKRLLCIDNQVTCTCFKLAVEQYDFPFNDNKLPPSDTLSSSLSNDAKLTLAIELANMMQQYGSSEMSKCIRTIRNAFSKSGPHDDYKAYKDWAVSMKSGDEEAIQIDDYRRKWSYVFQRYMILFRVGNLAYEMCSDVDFPGKGRMITFIQICKPLDYYNWEMGMPEEKWHSSAKPKVYDFLETYLTVVKKVEMAKLRPEF